MATAILSANTAVMTPKGEGWVDGYADGWYKVRMVDGVVLSFRRKSLEAAKSVAQAPAQAETQPVDRRAQLAGLKRTLTEAGFEHTMSVMDDSGTGGIFFVNRATGQEAVIRRTQIIYGSPKLEDVPSPSRVARQPKGNGSVAPKPGAKPRAQAQPAECKCGCGAFAAGKARHFLPGHDARFHGWMRRMAQGLLEPSEIPASARALMSIKSIDGIPTPTTDYDGSPWKLIER